MFNTYAYMYHIYYIYILVYYSVYWAINPASPPLSSFFPRPPPF